MYKKALVEEAHSEDFRWDRKSLGSASRSFCTAFGGVDRMRWKYREYVIVYHQHARAGGMSMYSTTECEKMNSVTY
jgi:hypothetical protein